RADAAGPGGAHVRGRGAQPGAPLPTRGGFGRSPTRARAAPWDLVGPPRGVGALADTTALGVSAGVGLLTDACRPCRGPPQHAAAPTPRVGPLADAPRPQTGPPRHGASPTPRVGPNTAARPRPTGPPPPSHHQRPGWARTPRPHRAQQAHPPITTADAARRRGPTPPPCHCPEPRLSGPLRPRGAPPRPGAAAGRRGTTEPRLSRLSRPSTPPRRKRRRRASAAAPLTPPARTAPAAAPRPRGTRLST
ncbi:MAG: hypothetical protein QOH30_90, partial [Baekduia sp.]|nr:hypothetical protein [Baekduia sp.]